MKNFIQKIFIIEKIKIYYEKNSYILDIIKNLLQIIFQLFYFIHNI